MSVQIRKTGFNFAALSERVRKNIADELNSGANSCVTLAQQLAPVDTGFMRDNIKQTETASPTELKAVIESEADYSAFVEYGTVNMEAQPFFTPAFESARRQVNNGLLRVLR
jgi:HK97 gp10 family phage protein